MSRSRETTTATVRIDGEILWTVYRERAEETLETAKELREAMEAVREGARLGLVVDIRAMRASTREARKFWADDDGDGRVEAVAVLVARGLASALGNFWVTVNRPKVPTRLFTSETDAVAWLKRFLNPEE